MEIEILSKSQYFLKKDNCCKKKITTFTFWQSCILYHAFQLEIPHCEHFL